MRSLYYFNVPTRRFTSSVNGDAVSLPKLAAGQQLTIATRFTDIVNGTRFETQLYVRRLRATIGDTDARPESGTVRIKIVSGASTSDNTTAAISPNVRAYEVANKLNALADKPATILVEELDGSWIVSREDGGELQISAIENKLRPMSFLRVNGRQLDGRWIYDVRPVVAPYAITSDFALVDPPAPTIETVRDGGESDGGSFKWAEVQALKLPADFRGTYQIRDPRTGARTRLLDRTDRIETIQSALREILAEGETVTVTLPEDRLAHLTFGGDLLGVDLEPFEIVVFSAPPGDPTFTLDLNHPRLLEALRRSDEIRDVPFEVEFELVETEAELSVPAAPAKIVKSSGLKVTLTRPVSWDGLETLATPTWLRPPSATSWKPFHPSQVGVGQLHYEEIIGNGADTTFQIDHNLGSQVLTGFVVINESTGSLVKDGYDIQILSENSFEITFDSAPAQDEFRIIVATPHELSVFLAGLQIEIEQVNGLAGRLDSIDLILAELQAVLPSAGPGATEPGISTKITIADNLFLFPDSRVRELVASLELKGSGDSLSLPKINEADLPRPPYLLRAIHDQSITHTISAVEALPTPESLIGNVAAIEDGNILLSGAGGIPTHTAFEIGNHIASDGRMLYAVRQQGDTSSYFPTVFERDLFVLPFTEQMIRVGATLEIAFDFAARLVRANCKAECYLRLQFGAYNKVTASPATAPNLSEIEWDEAAVIHDHRIVLSQNEITHHLGMRVKRLADSLTADRLSGGVWESALATPGSANFAVRARIVRFDTEDPSVQADPRGYFLGALFNAQATISK